MSWVTRAQLPIGLRLLRALLYGASVFLSFFLMLIFMTYNVCQTLYFDSIVFADGKEFQAYLILAVVLGATTGHFVFGAYLDPNAILSGASSRGMPCH
jgi:solute carrier family 31 (copper transporter), member 1